MQLHGKLRVSRGMNILKPSPIPESGQATASPKSPFLWLGLTLLVWFPLIAFLNAWVITVFWAWFIVPPFGAVPLSLPIAAGLELFFGFLVSRQTATPMLSEAAKEKFRELSWPERFGRMIVPNCGMSLLRVGIVLLFGAVVHLFVRH